MKLSYKYKSLIIIFLANFVLFSGCLQNKIISKNEHIDKYRQKITAIKSSKDLEVRVKAILEIGKTKNILELDNLLLLMNDDNNRIREIAAWALGEIKDAHADNYLIVGLKDEYPGVRQKCAEALGKLKCKWAVDALGIALNDKELEVKKSAIWALSEIDDDLSLKLLSKFSKNGNEEILKYLYEQKKIQAEEIKNILEIFALLRDKNPYIRINAIDKIEKMNDPFTIDLFMYALEEEENPEVKIEIIYLYGIKKYTRNMEFLNKALYNEINEISLAAIWALGEIGNEQAVKLLITGIKNIDHFHEHKVKGIIKVLKKIKDKKAIEVIIYQLKIKNIEGLMINILGEIKDSRAIKPMVEVLNNDIHLSCRCYAAEALAKIKSMEDVGPLIACWNEILLLKKWNSSPSLFYDYDDDKKIIWALGEIGDVRAMELLINIFVNNKFSRLKPEIIEAFGKYKDKRIVDVLINTIVQINVLKDIDYNSKIIKKAAIIALGKIKDKRAVDILISMITDTDIEIGKCSIEALGEIGDERAAEPIINILKNNDSKTIKEAIVALGKIGDPKIIDILITYLRNKNFAARQDVIWVLGELGNTKIIEHLIPLLNDTNIGIHSEVIKSLNKIDGNWRKSKEALSGLKKFHIDLKNESLLVRDMTEMVITEIAEKKPNYQKKSEIKILLNGHIADNMALYLNKKINILETEINNLYVDLDYNKLLDSKILIIPTCGLEKLDLFTLVQLKMLFCKFARKGGSILCFTQPDVLSYTALPVCINDEFGHNVSGYKVNILSFISKELEVVGFDYDDGYRDRVVFIEDYHPILSGINKTKIDFLCMDGYIKKWPKKSNIILKRNITQLPGFIIYRYGNGGYIALSNGYSEYAYLEKKDCEEERRIFRDTLTWLKNPNLLEDIICPEEGEKKIKLGPINLINNCQRTTNYAWIWIYSPDKKVIYDKIFKLKLNPKEKSNEYIDINIKPDSELGIYGIGYKLSVDSTFIYPSAKDDFAQSFAIHKNIKSLEISAIKKDINAIEPLQKALLDNDPHIRQYSFNTLDSIKSDWRNDIKNDKLIGFINNLKNKDPQIRLITLETLKKIDSSWSKRDEVKKVLPDFIHALIDKVPHIRKIAPVVIEKIEPNWINTNIMINLIPDFISALKNEDTEIRKIASKILMEKKDIRAFNPLILSLGEENIEARKNIITALENINPNWEKTNELNKVYQKYLHWKMNIQR
ncbi:MAG: HEAT repeat domain-containing protein [Nitrospirae bacterium]|nr:HEAT repeat domain-containing protein [Nitrospirota bacterium]